MSRTLVASSIAAALFFSAAGILALPVSSDAETETLKLELRQASPASAATAIRTLVGSRNIEIVGEHGLKIQDSAENLAIAEDVIGMLEQPSAVGDKPIFRAVASDDTVIVALRVEHGPYGDLLKALREEAHSRRVVVDSATSIVMIRDSQKGVDAALEIVKELDWLEQGVEPE
jgi:hypothetical protein